MTDERATDRNLRDALQTIRENLCTLREFSDGVGVSASTISNWHAQADPDKLPYGRFDIDRAVFNSPLLSDFFAGDRRLYLKSEIARVKSEYDASETARGYDVTPNSSIISDIVRLWAGLPNSPVKHGQPKLYKYALVVHMLTGEIVNASTPVIDAAHRGIFTGAFDDTMALVQRMMAYSKPAELTEGRYPDPQ